MNPDASPGVPWARLSATNGVLMRDYGELVWSCVEQRLKALCTCDCGDLTAEELVKAGLTDPIRVFVKNEPHSIKKLKEGRYRLIMSISVADNLVERLLNAELNNLEIAGYDRLPVKPGMGFSEAKIDSMGAYLEEFSELVSSDVSGWDWSVTADELRFDALRRIQAYGVATDHPLAKALMNRATCLSRSVITFSDGVMLAQRVDGVQKSGSYNTSSGNSWIRVAAARFSGAGMVCAMGDDCVDDGTDPERMSELGHPIKESVVVSASDPSWLAEVSLWPGDDLRDDVRDLLDRLSWKPFDESLVPTADFCSHWWCKLPCGKWVVVYRNWRKSLFRLSQVKTDRHQHLVEFVALMDYSPALPRCMGMLIDNGWFQDF